jgi:flavin reductase (DIM6/NTAB) family NADH-FMN oxidoreductase RutF
LNKRVEDKDMNFNQLFKQIPPEEVCEDVLMTVGMLAGKDFYAITAGREDHYNSMVAGGGVGMLFKKPVNWSFIRADRYTLEIIQKEQTYTLSYFPNEYKKQFFFLGSKSGRDSAKMREVELIGIQTPSGNMSFAETRMIIECKLLLLTTVAPDDIYAQEAKDFVSEEYKDENHYRKIAFGEITHVWVKQ